MDSVRTPSLYRGRGRFEVDRQGKSSPWPTLRCRAPWGVVVSIGFRSDGEVRSPGGQTLDHLEQIAERAPDGRGGRLDCAAPAGAAVPHGPVLRHPLARCLAEIFGSKSDEEVAAAEPRNYLPLLPGLEVDEPLTIPRLGKKRVPGGRQIVP